MLMKRSAAVVAVLCILALPVSAGDFDNLAKGIESHFGVQRVSPRLIGFALFLAKPLMWGSGVGGLKVATFEGGNRLTPSVRELDAVATESLHSRWRPFVRIDSRREGETTAIYADYRRKNMGMIIVTVERDDITVVEMKIDAESVRNWMSRPEEEAKEAVHKK